MIVMKFGGTSVGSAEAIRRVSNIIKTRLQKKPIIVVSAVGGITDKLVKLAKIAGKGEKENVDILLAEIIEKHQQIIKDLLIDKDVKLNGIINKGISELKAAVENILKEKSLNNQFYDSVICMGEFFSVNILVAFLNSTGIVSKMADSRDILVTDSNFSAARPLFDLSKSKAIENILPLVQEDMVPVIQGFVGQTEKGQTTTLGRGGSDYSATLFGAMLGVDLVEIWSDVDGVLTADPSLVPDAHRIRYMSFQEAAELAYFGAKVIHPATLAPAVERNITVIVLNSMNPDFAGTAISAQRPVDITNEGRVKSIAYKEGITVITVTSTRMLMAHGFMALLFAIFNKYETAVDLVSTSEVSVSMTIDNPIHLEKIISELQQFSQVKVENAKAIICLVGDALKRTPGIPGQIFSMLQDTHVYLISQGASEINLSFVIDQDQLPKVINRLHINFFSGFLNPQVFVV